KKRVFLPGNLYFFNKRNSPPPPPQSKMLWLHCIKTILVLISPHPAQGCNGYNKNSIFIDIIIPYIFSIEKSYRRIK
ncbi:MAG: hypothetical protein P9M05_09300, partial [Candidatus Stygibacter australis]|nr:hypothetical protein [Candidatus Stygibacter australis]